MPANSRWDLIRRLRVNVKRNAEHNTERTVMCSELVVMGEEAGVTCCRQYSDVRLE